MPNVAGLIGRVRPRGLIHDHGGHPGLSSESWLRLLRILAMVILVILAAALDSPLYRGRKQTQSSATCPRPWQFEAWIGGSCGLLSVLLFASEWTLQQDRKERRRIENMETLPSIFFETAATRAARAAARPTYTANPPQQRPSAAQSVPNLNAPAPPPPAAVRQIHGWQSTPTVNIHGTRRASGSRPVSGSRRTSASATASPTLAGPSRSASTVALPPDPHVASMLDHGRESLRHARQPDRSNHFFRYPDPYVSPADRKAMTRAKWLREVDIMARLAEHWLLIVRLALFILGHVLLFAPSPKTKVTCYKSAPFLWWGVFVGLLYEWFWVLKWGVVAAAVATILMCDLIYNLYKRFAIRMGWREAPPPRIAPIALPDPLSSTELLRCKTVCYVPDPEDPVSEDGHSVVEGDMVVTSEIDPSRLPYPAVILSAHRATCGVCHENFKAPREIARIMYKVTELRQLPCDHVFHAACVDQWLQKHSDACPYCTQSVREGLKRIETARSAAASRASLNSMAASRASVHSAVPASFASPAMASRASLPLHHSTTTLPYGSRAMPYSSAAAVSRSSLLSDSPGASRTSLPRMSQVSLSHAVSSPPSASVSRTSLHTEESFNVPMTTARNSISTNPATGSRVSLAYIHGARTSPSPTRTPQYPSASRAPSSRAASAAASRTSLVPVPEAGDVPPALPTRDVGQAF